MKRKHISLKVKLASALLKMLKAGEDGKLRPVIPFDESKTLSADQIISRFHFNHHPIPHACGGPDEPWNLDPEPVAYHREITAKVDIPRIAKEKRVIKGQAAHRLALNAKAAGELSASSSSKWPKGRKLQSRGFQKREERRA
jgi:hypothetical protein